eukprot:gene7169-9650_t
MSGVIDPSIRMDTDAYRKASTIKELDEVSFVLKAASRHLAERCAETSRQYMRCKKSNNDDPSKCLDEGSAVTNCGIEFFRVLRSKCPSELEAQATCLEKNNHVFAKCRKTQSALDDCVFDKLGMNGAFTTYDTSRSGSSYDK